MAECGDDHRCGIAGSIDYHQAIDVGYSTTQRIDRPVVEQQIRTAQTFEREQHTLRLDQLDLAERAVLVSTPWEPLWRGLNMARGKYIRELGNTPGHIQHFSKRALIRLAQRHIRITERRDPIPWTVLLGTPGAR